MCTAIPPTSSPISSHSPVCTPTRTSTPSSLSAAAPPGEELLDLFDDCLAVADEGEGVFALELHVARARDVLCQIARVTDVPDVLLGPVHDQRGHADPGEHMAHVEVYHRLED